MLTYLGKRAKAVQRAYTRLPVRFQVTATAAEIKGAEADRIMGAGHGGHYDPDERRISLRTGWDAALLLHELGHAAYFQALTEGERQAWDRYWALNRHRMPTDYARRDATEGFAECVASLYGGGSIRSEVARKVREFEVLRG